MTVKGKGDVAIIGMACMFPGAPDLQTYWHNILHKVDAVTDPPPEAWDSDVFYDPASDAPDRVYCKRGGYLGPLAKFNPLDYGIMPAGLDGGEPDQWLALKVAHDALADAGYLERLREHPEERHRTAVILGKGTYLNRGNLNMVQHSLIVEQTLQILQTLHPEYSREDLERIRDELRRGLPPFNAETAPGLVPNITAGRIANRLDLMGPSYTVDAACASSLIAVEIAMRELLTGRCDLALVGGAQVTTPIPILSLFCQLGALSRRQEIRPFDKNADGTILGEGIGIIVLKRREDAERDGDRIYAFIKGVGTASDGRGMSVLTPRVEGEVLALRRAYEDAGVPPDTIELIEAHGTGTPVGDQAEIQALREVFGERDGHPPRCALGSVKSMIGHTMPAAGIAGIIKVALALYYKVLPPTIHCDEPHPKLELEKTVFYINREARPWIHGVQDIPRRAGVNAFGFGGINAHVVMEEAPEAILPGPMRRWESEVVILAAGSRPELIERARSVSAYVEAVSDVSLLDLAYTLNSQINGQPFRLAVVAESPEDLLQKLARAIARLERPQTRQIKEVSGIYFFEEPLYPEGKLAFLFPGEGSQYPNMLADLCLHFPEVRACFDRIDRLFADHPRGYRPSDFIFPRSVGPGEEDLSRHLWEIDGAIEAVLTANSALFTLLSELGLRADAMVGHSTGEYSAMLAAGAIPVNEDEFVGRYLATLNRMYEEVTAEAHIPQAMMIAVGAGLDRVLPIIEQVEGEIYVGMDNCPHQSVIVGERAAVESAMAIMKDQGLIYEALPFERAYHTPLFAPYMQLFRDFYDQLPLAVPKVRLYSCVTAAAVDGDVAEIRRLAVETWAHRVRFRETIQAMYEDGIRIFVEVGARGNLTAFVGDILRGKPHLAIPANLQQRSGITQLNHLIAQLSAQGVPMEFDPLYRRRAPRRLELSAAEIAEARKKSIGVMKLATGWASMSLSPEVAADVRRHVAPSSPREREEGPSQPEVYGAAGIEKATTRPEHDRDAQAASSPLPDVEVSHPRRSSTRAQVMQAHLRLMEQFLRTQETVMRRFLAGSSVAPSSLMPQAERPTAAEPSEPDVPAGALVEETQEAERASDSEVSQGPSEAAMEETSAEEKSIQKILLHLVSAQTGYPEEMLDLSANLEADLGIDSIKRTEILGAFNRETGLLAPEEMEQVTSMKTLGEIIDFFERRQGTRQMGGDEPPLKCERTPAGSAAPESPIHSDDGGSTLVAPSRGISEDTTGHAEGARPPSMPFIRTVRAYVPGQELDAICVLDLNEDLFMRDHTLGRDVSRLDPDLLALPVVPLTISMEILAEAAASLLPDLVLVGMREVRAYRWILMEEGSISLRVVAKRRPAPQDHEVEVFLTEAEGDVSPRKHPIIEGVMVFASSYPASPPVSAFSLKGERPSRWSPQQLYAEGMFHGPAFRAVESIDRWGEDGAVATLQALPVDRFLRSQASPTFIAEPIVLDAVGQIVGFWTMEHLERGFVVFPYFLERLDFYGPPLSLREQIRCQARIRLLDAGLVRSDFDLIDQAGRLRIRLQGWEDKRFDLPRRFYRFILDPGSRRLSEPWTKPLAGLSDEAPYRCRRVHGFAEGFFEAHYGFWEKVLAHLALSRTERQVWRRREGPARRRIEWLLGRVTAKETVLDLLQERYGLALCPADIEIVQDENGRPLVKSVRPIEQIDRPLEQLIAVSISHAGGMAVAVAGPADEPIGVGIDIEPIRRQDEAFAEVAFTPQERALLATVEEGGEAAWPLRLWCAKEAAGKALGRGLVGGPHGIIVRRIDPRTGIMQASLADEIARSFPGADGQEITVYTAREGDIVVASVLGGGSRERSYEDKARGYAGSA
ncbi:MAG TPA: acyltransferase domain-containing protein [Caldilineae bacterium]|nr:acyltransferase domain-containing protein [Caldilineae bacterium]